MSLRWMLLLVGILASGVLAVPLPISAQEPTIPPGDSAGMSRRIDELLGRRWLAAGVKPAQPASDAEFIRRAYLDLTGRIPRVAEVRAFLGDSRPERRALLIETLLTKPDHATHFANTWRGFLLPDGNQQVQFGGAGAFEGWLRGKFADNDRYDKVVAELLLTSGQVNQAGPVIYYTSLELKPEELAASTSRAFLGVQIQCAQCHDHPFDHWKQQDFWGYAAFFARLARPQPPQQFAFAVTDAKEGEVKLPNKDEVVPPRFLKGELSPDKEGVTRRHALAAWLTAADNPYFAKAAVNRVWALMFGRGIVNPVDDLGEHNEPSHPELLNELASYFARSGFDIRNLIRTLANSQAYQLSSVAAEGDNSPPELFSRMAMKALTAEQLYDCLSVAVCRRENPANGQFVGNQVFDQNRLSFLTRFRTPAGLSSDYHGGIPQALTLMNGGLVAEATHLERSDVLVSLSAPFFSDRQRVETLFYAALSRPPSETERLKFEGYVSARSAPQERQAALSDILWALLNSAEFTLNH